MKMCIEEPKYLARALDYGIAAKVGSEGLDVTRQKKELLSLFYRAYSGLTKTLQHQCMVKGKTIDFPLIGKFSPRKTTNNTPEIIFVPHLDFIDSGRFKFP